MKTNETIYPIGVRDFKTIRENNLLYVDKTALIYEMVRYPYYMFFCRPRGFGKSLMVSIMRYYFEGYKELFTGLEIEKLETKWTKYPVLYFDLSHTGNFSPAELEKELHRMLDKYDEAYGIKSTYSPGSRLNQLISDIYSKTGEEVVLLIDGYDASLWNNLHDKETSEKIRAIMRNFYMSLKANYRYLRFVFITGEMGFTQSDMNNVDVVSTSYRYSSICGFTEQELMDNFKGGLESLSKDNGWSIEETLNRLKNQYGGYRFSHDLMDVYNPSSLINVFKNGVLRNYWNDTKPSSSLVKALKQHMKGRDLGLMETLESDKWASSSSFAGTLEFYPNIHSLLYQSGYLTIETCDRCYDLYTLGIPNEEVRVGLVEDLLPALRTE